jgi:hypothetical protein
MKATKPDAVIAAPVGRLCRPASLQINRLEDGSVIYQPEQERVHFLNQTAALALELCDGRRGFQEVEAQVAERFNLHEPGLNLTGDILQRFIAEGLVKLVSGPAAAAAGAPQANRRRGGVRRGVR